MYLLTMMRTMMMIVVVMMMTMMIMMIVMSLVSGSLLLYDTTEVLLTKDTCSEILFNCVERFQLTTLKALQLFHHVLTHESSEVLRMIVIINYSLYSQNS